MRENKEINKIKNKFKLNIINIYVRKIENWNDLV